MSNLKGLLKGRGKIFLALIVLIAIIGGIYIYKSKSELNNTVSSNKTVSEEKKDGAKKADSAVKKDNKKIDKEENKKKNAGDAKDKKKTKENKDTKKNETKPIVATKNAKTENEAKNNNDNKVSVYIRVEGYDKTIIPRQKISVGLFDLNPYLGKATGSSAKPSTGWGLDKFKKPTNAHAIITALKNHGLKPGRQNVAGSYDLQDYGWSLYMAMINGNREFDYRSTSGWLYKVNGVNPEVGCNGRELSSGDDIVWYFGAYGFDTVYSKISASTTIAKTGGEVTVKLTNENGSPIDNATIYANGKEYAKTNESGNAVLKFNSAGSYTISAERFKKDRKGKMLRDMVRPVPITVQVK